MRHSISFIGLLGLHLSENANDSDFGQLNGKTSRLYIVNITVGTFRLSVDEFSNMYEF